MEYQLRKSLLPLEFNRNYSAVEQIFMNRGMSPEET